MRSTSGFSLILCTLAARPPRSRVSPYIDAALRRIDEELDYSATARVITMSGNTAEEYLRACATSIVSVASTPGH